MVEAICDPAPVSGSFDAIVACSGDLARPGIDAPLGALTGSDLAGRFRHWLGASGRRYLFSVYPLRHSAALDQCPRYEEAVVLAVARDRDGRRRIAWMGQTSTLPDLVFEGGSLQSAVLEGANEIHMHLLATEHASREAVIQDLAG